MLGKNAVLTNFDLHAHSLCNFVSGNIGFEKRQASNKKPNLNFVLYKINIISSHIIYM